LRLRSFDGASWLGVLLHARLADTTPAELRVGAIYGRALGLGDILLPAPLAERHASDKFANAVFFAAPRLSRTILARLKSELPTARPHAQPVSRLHPSGRPNKRLDRLAHHGPDHGLRRHRRRQHQRDRM
jgi:hypothetical protein